jgi:hypothetical protein
LARFIKRQRIAFAEAQDIQHKEELKQLEQFDANDHAEGGVPLSKSLSACSEKTQQSQGKFVVWTSMLQRAMQTVETFNPAEYDIKVSSEDWNCSIHTDANTCMALAYSIFERDILWCK